MRVCEKERDIERERVVVVSHKKLLSSSRCSKKKKKKKNEEEEVHKHNSLTYSCCKSFSAS